MTTIRVTRHQVLKALKTETKLRGGAWLSTDVVFTGMTVASPHCQVCAVGAVLRAVLDPDQPSVAILRAADAATAGARAAIDLECAEEFKPLLASLLKQKLWLNALSLLFEYEVALLDLTYHVLDPATRAVIRRKLARFVLRHFPRSFKVDIDGAKPRRARAVVR